MFLGEDTHTLDPKGRIVLPSRYRDQLDDGCVLAPGRDGQLEIYQLEVYAEKMSDVIAAAKDKQGRQFARSAFRQADQQRLDKSGRVNVKTDLISWANLESDVVVLGAFDHIELWNPAAYEADRENDRYRDDGEVGTD